MTTQARKYIQQAIPSRSTKGLDREVGITLYFVYTYTKHGVLENVIFEGGGSTCTFSGKLLQLPYKSSFLRWLCTTQSSPQNDRKNTKNASFAIKTKQSTPVRRPRVPCARWSRRSTHERGATAEDSYYHTGT